MSARSAWHFSRLGFTLPEVLITTALLVMIIGAVLAAVSGGYRVWGRTAEYGVNEQASLVAFEQMRRDLHNAAPFRLIPFAGARHELTFAVVSREPGAAQAPREIGRHGYYLDEQRDLLCRSFAPYRLSREVRLKDRCEVVLEHVQRFDVEYFGAPSQTAEAAWSEDWEADTLPAAVKVSVVLRAEAQPASSHAMVMFLPALRVGRDDET
jgi:type II secretory pathway component PulJ